MSRCKNFFKILFFLISLLNFKIGISTEDEAFKVKATSSSYPLTDIFPSKALPNKEENEHLKKNQNLEQDVNITFNPNVISICSGYGVTDRMFLQAGFRILSSIDKDSKRTAINTINNVNVISKICFRHKILSGDITDQDTIQECLSSVQNILKNNQKGNQDLNLLYAFIPWGKHVKTTEIIDNIFELVLALKKEQIVPQIICFEMNSTAQKKYNGISHNKKYKDLLDSYVEQDAQIDMSHYGIAATNQRYYKLWIRNTVKIFNFPTQQNKSSIKNHLDNFRMQYPHLIPEGWWDQPSPYIENFPLHSFDCALSDEKQKILAKWERGKALKELPCENNTDCLICLTCQFKQAVNKERGGRNNSFQRTLIDGFYPTPITKNSYKWWLNPHPTQNRAYTMAELMALFGYGDLQNFRFTDRETIQADSFIEFIAQPTSPHFLKQLFTNLYNVFDLASNPLQLDLTKMPVLFYSGKILYTAASNIKFIYEIKDNPSTFLDQFKKKNSIYIGNSRFLNTLSSIYSNDFQTLKKSQQEKFIKLMPYIKIYAGLFEFVVNFRNASQNQPLLVDTLEKKMQPLTDCLLGYYPYVSSTENHPYHCDLRKIFKNSRIQKTLTNYGDILNNVKIELINNPNKIEIITFEKISSQNFDEIPHNSTNNNKKRKENTTEDGRKSKISKSKQPAKREVQGSHNVHDQSAHEIHQQMSPVITPKLPIKLLFRKVLNGYELI